jgi:hypothetical protein
VEDLSDFKRGQIVGARLAGASLTQTAHIVRCIERENFYGYFGIHESWEDNISEEEPWTELMSYIKTVLKNHTTTEARVTRELHIHVEDPTFTYMSNVSFTNPHYGCNC